MYLTCNLPPHIQTVHAMRNLNGIDCKSKLNVSWDCYFCKHMMNPN
jgi:hypothetical protein